MIFSYRLIAATVALVPAVAMANQLHTDSDPVDANAAVPTLVYQSSFASYRFAADDDATPDSNWISANQEVAGGGHSMHNMHDTSTPSASPVPMNMQGAHEAHGLEGH